MEALRYWNGGAFRGVSYTNLRAHETVLDLGCRLLLEKKKKKSTHNVANPQLKLTDEARSHKAPI